MEFGKDADLKIVLDGSSEDGNESCDSIKMENLLNI